MQFPSSGAPTPLIELPRLAALAGVSQVWIKAECDRPLGSFKFLGGTLAGLRALERAGAGSSATLICASDGNHGLAVAAAAARAGARARIYLPDAVSAQRVERIIAQGAQIQTVAGSYDDAVNEAAAAAARGEGILVPDTSADPMDPVVRDVMAGYSQLVAELVQQMPAAAMPTHVFAQAGVGGLAAALAVGLKPQLREPGQLLVVEPATAACVAAGLQAGHPVQFPGTLVTCAEMLSCGVASAAALEILLARGANPMLVDEAALLSAPATLLDCGGPATTPSGAAGLAGLLHVAARDELRSAHALGRDSSVLLIVTEGPLAGTK
jgi:diaminopropionate ammonia-lyase